MRNRHVVLLWENFGPYHEDRCEAVAVALGPEWTVTGIAISRTSNTYGWSTEGRSSYQRINLTTGIPSEQVPFLTRLRGLLKVCWDHRGSAFFLCHYEQPATVLIAALLRLFRQDVFIMSESKFDDYDRFLYREILKSLFYLPYKGALASSTRTFDYLRFLGVPLHRVASGYNTVSIDRVRSLAGAPPAPDGVPYAERHFTIVARLVPKKNLTMALEAYALYHRNAEQPRELHLCGSGPLEQQLVAQAAALGISESVCFRGWLQERDTCLTLATTLALLLPSVEEQFGNVVIEAQAMGLPVILSENCGARDQLVRTGVNGFVVEPDNPAGMAFFMEKIAMDEKLWRRMADEATASARLGDSPRFADGVMQLIAMVRKGLPVTRRNVSAS